MHNLFRETLSAVLQSIHASMTAIEATGRDAEAFGPEPEK
jgi:hypothetical protein